MRPSASCPTVLSAGPICLCWALACGGGGPAPPPSAVEEGRAVPPAAEGGQAESLTEADRLRSLPYLNFAPEKADPGEGGVRLYDPERAYPGYDLYTLRGLRTAELADLHGRVVHRWSWPGPGLWVRSELLPDGDLLVVGSTPDRRYLLRLTFAGEPVWQRDLPVHHDVELTPSGQLLAITSRERRETVEGEEMRLRDDRLTLLDSSGVELASISLYDAFRRAEALSGRRLLQTVRAGQGGVYDFFHANSVEWMNRPRLFGSHPLYDPRHVLVSIKHQDLVAILDWDRKELVWWWGRGELDGQHDARLLGNGNVLIFDNGLRRKWGRVLEVDPRTDRIVWQYSSEPKEKLYTRNLGAAQRLPNGNTLIAESERGHAFEVTREGEVVWDFRVPRVNKKGHRASLVRIVRHEKEFIEKLVRTHRQRRAPPP